MTEKDLVPIDEVGAVWVNLAHDVRRGKEITETLAAQMGPEDLLKAQLLVSSFLRDVVHALTRERWDGILGEDEEQQRAWTP